MDGDALNISAAGDRVIGHKVGSAALEQSALKILSLYSARNFYFHAASVFAVLRQSDVKIGRRDFAGLHIYPPDFNFETGP